jgi:hypothetical protein
MGLAFAGKVGHIHLDKNTFSILFQKENYAGLY